MVDIDERRAGEEGEEARHSEAADEGQAKEAQVAQENTIAAEHAAEAACNLMTSTGCGGSCVGLHYVADLQRVDQRGYRDDD